MLDNIFWPLPRWRWTTTRSNGSRVPPRECARTVRSSSKVSNPLFQPLIGSQEPPPLVLVPVINFDCPGKKRRFLTSVAGKIAKLAGGACGRRWLRQLRSQTQSLTAQEATFEGRGEREEISLRQCVLRDHQIRSGSGLFIHSASTHHYTNRSVGQAPRLHRRIWQRRRCLHSDNVDANLKNCSGIIKDEGGWCS